MYIGIISTSWSAEIDFDQTCNDINECTNNPCAHGCHNYYNSYQCYCMQDQQAKCDPKKMDLLFILDRSEDILEERFNYFKDFIKKFLMPIEVSDQVRLNIDRLYSGEIKRVLYCTRAVVHLR